MKNKVKCGGPDIPACFFNNYTMNNQTPTTEKPIECECYTAVQIGMCNENCDRTMKRLTPPAEQAAEAKTFLDEHTLDWSELKTRFDRHAQCWTTYSAAQEYADLRIKETLEAAAMELPTTDEALSVMDKYSRREPNYDEQLASDEQFAGMHMYNFLRDKAAPIIAAKDKEIARLRLEAQADDVAFAALSEEKNVLHSRVRELEAQQAKVHSDYAALLSDHVEIQDDLKLKLEQIQSIIDTKRT